MDGITLVEDTGTDKHFLRQTLEMVSVATYPDLVELGRVSRRERLDAIFESYYGRSDKRIWLARQIDGTPVGMIWLQPSVHPVHGEEDFMIINIVVLEEFRGRGIGRALLSQAQAHASKKGVKRIRLFVAAWNEAAVALYRSCGFEIQTHEMLLKF